ncbi:hypothetical protein N7488_000457 [Penicillium malachiteum]|nr:hypothetical protein N7488_000457 [Penicillium malachiteum]
MARMKQGVFSWEDVLAQRYQSNKPSPLPRSRRRTLTLPQPQLQCHLLSRLSPEIRLMIWEMVLNGRRFHIIQRSHQRLGHIVCPHSGTSSPSDKRASRRARDPFCEICNGGGIPQPVKEGDLNTRAKATLLNLALTSRQIYYESIHLLYTLNTFEFSNPWSLPYLRPTIPSEYWDCIRNVELRWSFHGHWLPSKDPVRAVYVSAGQAQWHETCRVLSKLPTLKSFVLVLGSTWYSESVERLPIFLEPLRGLRVQRSRFGTRRDRLFDEDEFSSESGSGAGLSSDEESTSSFSSSSSSSSISRETELRSYRYSCSVGLVPMAKSDASATWELRLQGQPYYGHELGRLGEDLRRKGIDCVISMT